MQADKEMPPRPIFGAPETRMMAIEPVIGAVMEWFVSNGEPPPERGRLEQIMLQAFETDAFAFGKQLELFGWAVDAALIRILDDISLTQAHARIVRAWVRQYGVTVPFTVGQDVCTASMKRATVVQVWVGTAQIVVQPEGEMEKWATQPNSGHIVDYERATLIAGIVGEAVPV